MKTSQLTKRERYLRTVRGKETDRPPVWIMRQAGRYMPEYMEMRQRHSFHDFCRKPEISTAATLLPLEILDVDILIIFNDILIPLEEMGLQVEFPEGGPRIINPIRKRADLKRIHSESFINPPVAQSLQLVKAQAGEEIPVLGFAGSPFTLAVYAVEGHMTRNQEHIKRLMFEDPETLHELLEAITFTAANYLVSQIQEGKADGIQIFESWGGILAMPHDYEDFAARWQRMLIDLVREQCPETPIHLYVRGSSGRIQAMERSEADVLSIDWSTPLAEARKQTSLTLQGNLDPMVLLSEESVSIEFPKMLDGFDWKRGWIANLGHGITPQADWKAAKRFVDCVKALGETG